jgi:acetylglutamate kinase
MTQVLLDKAELLAGAQPYLQRYHKKTIVVKYGGNAMTEDSLKAAVIEDIVFLSKTGINIVVVHGGGPEINKMLEKINKEPRFVDGLRYTDRETMDVVQQVLCGKINKDLAAMINHAGGKAVGLCGMDGGMISAVKLDKDGKDFGLVGEITGISPDIINDVIDKGYLPVISGIAYGTDGNPVYNINADTAAARLAVALGAAKLILLTDIRGIMKDVKEEDSLIPKLTLADIPGLKEQGILKGGMIPKVDCCVEALEGGVAETHIIDGRIEHSLLMEILSDESIGTVITAD